MDRDFYKLQFGFDPVSDRITKYPPASLDEEIDYIMNPLGFRYEVTFPLVEDAILHAAGISIGARCDVFQDGTTHNRVFFKRGELEIAIRCVHTVLNSPPNVSEETPLSLGLDRFLESGNMLTDERSLASHNSPVLKISPQDHFIALKSYVAGIAEVGLSTFLAAKREEKATLGELWGNLQYWHVTSQLINALLQIAPDVYDPFIRGFLIPLIDALPTTQLGMAWTSLNLEFNANKAFFGKPEDFLSLPELTRRKISMAVQEVTRKNKLCTRGHLEAIDEEDAVIPIVMTWDPKTWSQSRIYGFRLQREYDVVRGVLTPNTAPDKIVAQYEAEEIGDLPQTWARVLWVPGAGGVSHVLSSGGSLHNNLNDWLWEKVWREGATEEEAWRVFQGKPYKELKAYAAALAACGSGLIEKMAMRVEIGGGSKLAGKAGVKEKSDETYGLQDPFVRALLTAAPYTASAFLRRFFLNLEQELPQDRIITKLIAALRQTGEWDTLFESPNLPELAREGNTLTAAQINAEFSEFLHTFSRSLLEA